MSPDHATLYERHELLKAQALALSEALLALNKARYMAELALYEAEGRGHLAHAEWIRRWLAGDCDGASQVLRSEEYQREERSHPAPVSEAA